MCKKIITTLSIFFIYNYLISSSEKNFSLKNPITNTHQDDTQGLGQKSRSHQQKEFKIKTNNKNFFTKYFCCLKKDKRLLMERFNSDNDL